MVNIIGITGRKRHGKDTLGDHLVKNHGYTKIGFADALKDACREIFGFSEEQLYGNLKEVDDPFWKTSPRKVLQYVGTELFRERISEILPEVGQDIWIKVVENKILSEQLTNPDKKYVITDVRFENELQFIKRLKGQVIKVQRDVKSIDNTCDHASETYIDSIEANFTIKNDGTLEELYEKLDTYLFYNNYKKISSFDKIKILDENTLYVFDIDETLMVYDGIDRKWWKKNISKRPEEEVLNDWIEYVSKNDPKHTHESTFFELIEKINEREENKIICLTARKDTIKDITEEHMAKIGVTDIPIYYSNGTCKGKILKEIIKDNSTITNIVFVDDNKKNLYSVTKEFHNSYIKVDCYYFKYLE